MKIVWRRMQSAANPPLPTIPVNRELYREILGSQVGLIASISRKHWRKWSRAANRNRERAGKQQEGLQGESLINRAGSFSIFNSQRLALIHLVHISCFSVSAAGTRLAVLLRRKSVQNFP